MPSRVASARWSRGEHPWQKHRGMEVKGGGDLRISGTRKREGRRGKRPNITYAAQGKSPKRHTSGDAPSTRTPHAPNHACGDRHASFGRPAAASRHFSLEGSLLPCTCIFTSHIWPSSFCSIVPYLMPTAIFHLYYFNRAAHCYKGFDIPQHRNTQSRDRGQCVRV